MHSSEPLPADRIFVTLAGVSCLLLATMSTVSLTTSLLRMILGDQSSFLPIWLTVRISSFVLIAVTLAGGIGLVMGRQWGWTLAIASICFGLLYLAFNVVFQSLVYGFSLDNYLGLAFIAINALKVVALVFLFLPATRQVLGIGKSHFLTAGALMLGLTGMTVFGEILVIWMAS